MFKPEEVEITIWPETVPGGMRTGRIHTGVLIRHLPTGRSVMVDVDRSQHKNKAIALEILEAHV